MTSFNIGDKAILVVSRIDHPWDGAEVKITEVYEEGSLSYMLFGDVVYDFEVLDKSLPRWDGDLEADGYEWLGLAYEHELIPKV